MKRREYITITSAGLMSFSGCVDSATQFTGTPEVEWEGELSGWYAPPNEYLILVHGDVYNVGETTIDRFDLECSILDQRGNIIASRENYVRGLVEGTRQQFYFTFYPRESEMEQTEDFDIKGNFPD